MNQFLADVVGRLNKVLAVVFVVMGVLGGSIAASDMWWWNPGLAVAALLGVTLTGIVLAISVCGLLALVVSIYEVLKDIRRLLETEGKDASAPDNDANPVLT